MEFTDELLKKLESEGICWTREEDGTLSYMSAYEHALAEVYPKDKCFVIKNECRDASDDGTLVDRTFGDCTDPEQLLRDIACAAGEFDSGVERMLESVCGYDIREY